MTPRCDSVLRFCYLSLCFVFIACFSQPHLANPLPPPEADTTAANEEYFDIWKDNPDDFYAIVGESPRPGDPVTVIFLPAQNKSPSDEVSRNETPDHSGTPRPEQLSLVSGGGRRLGGAAFFDWTLDDDGHTVKACVFAVPSTFDGDTATIRAGDTDIFKLSVKERGFVAEDIPLNPSNTALRTIPDPRKTAEAERLWAILSRNGDTVYTTGPFTPPVAADTRRTSFFGDRRVYRYSNGKSDTAVHAGIDYGVPTGTPVRACAAGKVVLAGERVVTGNSVIIEHLPGMYSIYYHLDKIYAEENLTVGEGDVIGLSGATGLATGPHLHWELRVAAENTDPDILCARPILDREAAKKIIYERREEIYAKP
ncbi:MAG: M23 family metallopeptidase [Spirochaetaceae bacterium]|jgi:murein DD-endopeptidase MepM/ murein hydrolase activator NlpD|nr:M23 family metallopeptidase [Spirochaetaceae bacterium]